MYAERKTITLTADASGNVTDYIPVEYECIVTANDRVKFVISNGGNAKSGTFTVVYG